MHHTHLRWHPRPHKSQAQCWTSQRSLLGIIVVLAVCWNLLLFRSLQTKSSLGKYESGSAQRPTCFQYPEADLFLFAPRPLRVCGDESLVLPARSLQHSLRLCLAHLDCASVQWDAASAAATLCLTVPDDEPQPAPQGFTAVGGICSELQHSSIIAAWRLWRGQAQTDSDDDSDHCPEGQLAFRNGSDTTCDVCPTGICNVLPGAEVLQGIDSQVQAQVAGLGWAEHGHRGFNPTMLSHQGRDYVVVRAGNLTFCPGASHVEPQEHGEGQEEPGGDDPAPSQFDTKVLLCPFDGALGKLRLPCTHIPVEVARLNRPPGFSFSKRFHGFEDTRAVVWRGSAYLVGTVNWRADKPPQTSKGNARWRQADEQEWKRHKWFFDNAVAVAKLTKDLSGVEYGAVLQCKGLGGNQKNWMPLVYGGDLYLVAKLLPLTVVKVEGPELSCRIVQQDAEQQQQQSFVGVLPEGSFLSGGSPFAPLPGNRFLGLAHHHATSWSGRVYSHHFVIVTVEEQAAGQPHFVLSWVSDTFRLPDGGPTRLNIQFAAGLLQRGTDLYISYGVADCYTALARVEEFQAWLFSWEEYGIGTQKRAAPNF